MQETLRAVNECLSAHDGVVPVNGTGFNAGDVVMNDDATADQKLATGDAAAPENEVYLSITT